MINSVENMDSILKNTNFKNSINNIFRKFEISKNYITLDILFMYFFILFGNLACLEILAFEYQYLKTYIMYLESFNIIVALIAFLYCLFLHKIFDFFYKDRKYNISSYLNNLFLVKKSEDLILLFKFLNLFNIEFNLYLTSSKSKFVKFYSITSNLEDNKKFLIIELDVFNYIGPIEINNDLIKELNLKDISDEDNFVKQDISFYLIKNNDGLDFYQKIKSNKDFILDNLNNIFFILLCLPIILNLIFIFLYIL